ncbi:MAG: nucleotide sugar dehydrogenase [Deltaproteobacteria bacterium]|nr:nucleotide sugar dehydrogenase [Deltaproteobacteria bacterium]
MTLKEKIGSRKAAIGVIGAGYVGLPLSVRFAECGFRVTAFEIDERKVEAIQNGRSYIADVGTATLAKLVNAGKFTATTDMAKLAACDAVSICVPTPLNKTRDPDVSAVLAAVEAIKRTLHKNELVIVESTTYPGFTREAVLPMFAETGLKVGDDFFLAFSPERVDPGNPTYHVKNTPKIVGGHTPRCLEHVALLYGEVVDHVVRVSSTDSAEMAKLLENTFRAVNIGLVNEVALMCKRLGIDTWEVIEAAASKPFGFMPFYPGPGLGGHCIPVDPHYLSWKMKTLNYTARFIDLAGEVNSAMPRIVVELVVDALNVDRKAVNGSRVLVCGVSYKRDSDDLRESPALDVIELLLERSATVDFHDPHVPELTVASGHRFKSVDITRPGAIEAYDAAIIVTDHRALDVVALLERASLVIDTRNATKAPLAATPKRTRARVVRL